MAQQVASSPHSTGVFLPRTQCFQDRLQIHRDRVQGKAINEDETDEWIQNIGHDHMTDHQDQNDDFVMSSSRFIDRNMSPTLASCWSQRL